MKMKMVFRMLFAPCVWPWWVGGAASSLLLVYAMHLIDHGFFISIANPLELPKLQKLGVLSLVLLGFDVVVAILVSCKAFDVMVRLSEGEAQPPQTFAVFNSARKGEFGRYCLGNLLVILGIIALGMVLFWLLMPKGTPSDTTVYFALSMLVLGLMLAISMAYILSSLAFLQCRTMGAMLSFAQWRRSAQALGWGKVMALWGTLALWGGILPLMLSYLMPLPLWAQYFINAGMTFSLPLWIGAYAGGLRTLNEEETPAWWQREFQRCKAANDAEGVALLERRALQHIACHQDLALWNALAPEFSATPRLPLSADDFAALCLLTASAPAERFLPYGQYFLEHFNDHPQALKIGLLCVRKLSAQDAAQAAALLARLKRDYPHPTPSEAAEMHALEEVCS